MMSKKRKKAEQWTEEQGTDKGSPSLVINSAEIK
jgi:hypothetical protein